MILVTLQPGAVRMEIEAGTMVGIMWPNGEPLGRWYWELYDTHAGGCRFATGTATRVDQAVTQVRAAAANRIADTVF